MLLNFCMLSILYNKYQKDKNWVTLLNFTCYLYNKINIRKIKIVPQLQLCVPVIFVSSMCACMCIYLLCIYVLYICMCRDLSIHVWRTHTGLAGSLHFLSIPTPFFPRQVLLLYLQFSHGSRDLPLQLWVYTATFYLYIV